MDTAWQRALALFTGRGPTERIVAALAFVDDDPHVEHYTDLQGAAAALGQGLPLTAGDVAGSARLQHAMLAAGAMDTGDAGLTLLTGARTALALYAGLRDAGALVQQQRADASIKLLGLSFVLERLGPTPDDRRALLTELPAGRDLLRTFALLEVVLPFWRTLHGGIVAELFTTEATAARKWIDVLGVDGVALARSTADEAILLVQAEVDRLGPKVVRYAEKLSAVVGPARAEGLSSGLVALGVDALPVYTLLVARLAAESCLRVPPRRDEVLHVPDLVEAPTDAPPVPEHLRPRGADHADGLLPETTLSGCFQRGESWWVFTSRGVVADVLPTTRPPCWDLHLAQGAFVGTYRVDADHLVLLAGDQTHARHHLAVDGVDLLLDGERWRRGDFDLRGQHLDGTYAHANGRLDFGPDGSLKALQRQGRYTLGPAAIRIAWDDGETVTLPFVAVPDPSAERPAVLYLSGAPWSRLPGSPPAR